MDLELLCERISCEFDVYRPRINLTPKYINSVVYSHNGGATACTNEGRRMKAAIVNIISQVDNFQDALEEMRKNATE